MSCIITICFSSLCSYALWIIRIVVVAIYDLVCDQLALLIYQLNTVNLSLNWYWKIAIITCYALHHLNNYHLQNENSSTHTHAHIYLPGHFKYPADVPQNLTAIKFDIFRPNWYFRNVQYLRSIYGKSQTDNISQKYFIHIKVHISFIL